MSNPRRRETLAVLGESSTTYTLRELSEMLATAESGLDPAPRALRESVYNALHQTHLPKMDSLGLVAYDADRKTVTALPQSRQLTPYMDVVTRAGVSWGEYYRALGLVGLVATTTTLADVPLVGAVDPLVPATVFLALFAVSTAYQLIGDSIRSRVHRLLRRE
ncbi:MAG: hypothetical protein U5K28_08985 [Halobacteriales archaeon]|nr:hypothetical protein [Halobacteriales archaeon]